MRGIKYGIAPPRPVQQVPLLERYHFVPYVDDQRTRNERETCVREYVHVCNHVAQLLLEWCDKNSGIIDVMNSVDDVPEPVLERYRESRAENQGLLKILTLIKMKSPRSTSSLEDSVKLAFAAHKKELERDVLNTALFEEDPLKHLLDVVVENTSLKKIRVLELVFGESSTLLAPWVSRLLSLSNPMLKIEYTVAQSFPGSIQPEELLEGARKVTWDPNTFSGVDFSECDFIVAYGVTTTSVRLDILAEKLSSQCKKQTFLLLAARTGLSAAEMLLSTICELPFRTYAIKSVELVFRTYGFCLAGLKSNNISMLMLLRKSLDLVEAEKQQVLRVKNARFDWVESLKQKALQYESRPEGENIWLLADDVDISGVVGLTNCLLQEAIGNHIRYASGNSANVFSS